MTKPEVIIGGTEGVHNVTPPSGREYKDLSTICVVPTRGMIPARVVESWMGLQTPMNQKFTRMMVSGLEVGAAYTTAIETILAHPELSKWKYVLTLEEDNLPAPDGLLRLYEAMEHFDIVGGLYWTKGEEGQPMAYGKPDGGPLNFVPWMPPAESISRVHGVGMGFTLFKLDIFRDEKLDRPFFQTVQTFDPNSGSKGYSQDLHFCERVGKLGYKLAVDTRVRVGHLDPNTGIVW